MKLVFFLGFIFFIHLNIVWGQPFQDFPIQYQPKPQYKIPHPKTYYVPLRDGIHLAVDVYVPKSKNQQKISYFIIPNTLLARYRLNFPLFFNQKNGA
ncbi:MAG: hypothetical protein KatS3mg035_0065 [Bacteroidia bacterium]|nr:MAG: hypothetical protein KatS3mg035_0065 [Bacteroidia bacterium]